MRQILTTHRFLNIGYFKLLIVTMGEVVKIQKDLLSRIEKLIKNKDKKIIYSSRKQFVNIAVLKLIKKEENDQ